MNPPAEIFRAYDIRGVFGESLTEKGARLIGRALGGAAAAKKIHRLAVGRDGRISSPTLAAALSLGIRESGIGVVNIGLAPTPLLYFAAHRLADASGAMVTGSHNPKSHNGIKIMLNGETLAGEAVADLHRRIVKGDYPQSDSPPPEESANVKDDYIKAVRENLTLHRPMKIVLDCGNGVAGAIAPELFRALGCETENLFCEVDGNFPNHHPDPANPDNLRDAEFALNRANADVAFAFDGDGDRLGVISPHDGIIAPDRLLMAFARDSLSRKQGGADAPPQAVVFDVKCTMHLAPWILRYGGIPAMCRTGHSFIKAKMREMDAPLGGELSGHFFFRDGWPGFDDALYAGARLLSLADAAGGMKNLMRGIPNSSASPELQIRLEKGESPFELIAQLRRQANFPTAKRIVEIDGLRAEYDDGFGLARASNTAANLIFRFEGATDSARARIEGEFRKNLAALNLNAVLPF